MELVTLGGLAPPSPLAEEEPVGVPRAPSTCLYDGLALDCFRHDFVVGEMVLGRRR